jgi:hypothetical protein
MKPIFQPPALRHAILKANGWLLAAALLLLATTPTSGAESLSVLLQKAIFAEETEGNLDAAIKIYEGIAKDGEAKRSLVAQAQYRLGVCQFKKGQKSEAAAAFRKIVNEFAAETELVAKARTQLAELGQSPAAAVLRQVWSDVGDADFSRVSPDGQILSFIDWNTGDLWLRDLKNGSNRKLTEAGTNSSEHATSSVFSPDGKQIAYDWWNQTNDSYELRLITINDPKPRVIIAHTNRWVFVGDWSADGKMIAIEDWKRENREAKEWKGWVTLISVDDGSDRRVVSLEATNITSLRFSPDGRHLAYNFQHNRRSAPGTQITNDIFVVDVHRNTQRRIVEHFAKERFLGWGPRGHELVFSSERRETMDLWTVQLMEGQPGQPKLLKAGVGDIDPIGITRDGSLFYSSAGSDTKNLYIVSLDVAEGRVLAPPKEVQTRVVGLTDKATGSRDGRYLFFRAGLKEPAAFIRDMESGEQRELQSSRSWASQIGWWWPSPDSSAILVSLYGPENEGGFYIVDTQTGVKSPLALHGRGILQVADPLQIAVFESDFVAHVRRYSSPKKIVLVKHDLKTKRETEYEIPGLPDAIPQPGRNRPGLLPDGRSFFFNRRNSANLNVLVWHDLVTGSQKEFLTTKSPVSGFPNSDCSLVRFVTDNDQGRPVYTLYSFANLELRQTLQVTVPAGFQFWGELWEGPYIILKKTEERDRNAPSELWRLSVRTGELKSLGLSLPRTQYWGFSPNGKWLLYHVVDPASREVWVMENLLPQMASGALP